MTRHTYLLSSSTANGAKNKSSDGSIFELSLDQPIQVPKTARDIKVSVVEAHVWNNVYNISAALANNKFAGTFEDLAGTGTDVYDLTIPDGQYSLPHLEHSLKRLIINGGGSTTNEPFHFISDASQGRVVILLDNANTIIDFTNANPVRTVLGFDSQTITSATDLYVTAENTANFNNINQFQIHSDLVGNGIPVNSKYTNTLCQIPITASSGSLINYSPRNVTEVSAPELRGSTKNHVRCWLTSENNESVDTNGEEWSFRIIIDYEI